MEMREIIAALHRELEFLDRLILSMERQGLECALESNDGSCRPRMGPRPVANQPRKTVHRPRGAS